MAVSAQPVVAPSRTMTSKLPSRPTTPLRSASRTSLRASRSSPSGSDTPGSTHTTRQQHQHHGASSIDFALAALEPAFAELSDSMADLEANFMHLQLLNESVARFNENFAAFLYGLNMTAFCVDFPEAPIIQSFNRHGSTTCQLDNSPYRHNRLDPTEDEHAIGFQHEHAGTSAGVVHDATFLTTDTSFVVNPPSNAAYSKSSASKPPNVRGSRGNRGTNLTTGRGRGRGAPVVAGTDANGKRITRLPAGPSRGAARGSAGRGRGTS